MSAKLFVQLCCMILGAIGTVACMKTAYVTASLPAGNYISAILLTLARFLFGGIFQLVLYATSKQKDLYPPFLDKWVWIATIVYMMATFSLALAIMVTNSSLFTALTSTSMVVLFVFEAPSIISKNMRLFISKSVIVVLFVATLLLVLPFNQAAAFNWQGIMGSIAGGILLGIYTVICLKYLHGYSALQRITVTDITTASLSLGAALVILVMDLCPKTSALNDMQSFDTTLYMGYIVLFGVCVYVCNGLSRYGTLKCCFDNRVGPTFSSVLTMILQIIFLYLFDWAIGGTLLTTMEAIAVVILCLLSGSFQLVDSVLTRCCDSQTTTTTQTQTQTRTHTRTQTQILTIDHEQYRPTPN